MPAVTCPTCGDPATHLIRRQIDLVVIHLDRPGDPESLGDIHRDECGEALEDRYTCVNDHEWSAPR